MAIRRPAGSDSSLFYDHQAMRVGQRQGLIAELFGHPTGINHFVGSKRQYRESRQLFDKPQKLDGSPLIVPAEKPTMAFRDHQSGCHHWRWLGEQPLRMEW
jgi:hypothetical protein